MKTYNVYHEGKRIDTVFWVDKSTREEVRLSLINHDGYPADIRVWQDHKNGR